MSKSNKIYSMSEEKLQKIRDKKKIIKDKKKAKLKEIKFQEKKDKKKDLPKKVIYNHFLGKKEKKKLKKKISMKKSKDQHNENVIKFQRLSDLESLEGRILGCVKEIHNWGLVIELPNFLSASVHITNINDVYTELMEKYSNDEILEITELSDLFSIGELVVAKITECITKENGQKIIKATLNPSDVNGDFLNTNLETGLILQACVRSKEDYGYLLDVGIKNTRVFIKYDNVNIPLGQIVSCLITNVKPSISMTLLEVTLDQEQISETRLSPKQISVLNLIPGMKIIANVTQVLSDGWKIKLKNTNFRGFVSFEHTSNVASSKYLCNKQVDLDCVVLYVTPNTFQVYVSCDESLIQRKSSENELAVGCFTQNGEIKHIESGRLYFHSLDDNLRGYINQYNGGCKPELFHAKFSVGEIIKECRIIQFHRIDNIYEASLSRKVLSAVGSLSEINLGDIISCKVSFLSPKGVNCTVGYYKIKAFCSDYHLNGRMEDYNVGEEVQAKVIYLNYENNFIVVSFKHIYILSEILSTVKNTKPGMLIWGILKEKIDNYVLIEFDNEIKGIFPIENMSKNTKINYYQNFKSDTVIVCQILKYENGELLLSEADETIHALNLSNQIEMPLDSEDS